MVQKTLKKLFEGEIVRRLPIEIQNIGRRKLSSYFGNSAKFWLGLQDDYDIEAETPVKSAVFEKIRHRMITHNAD